MGSRSSRSPCTASLLMACTFWTSPNLLCPPPAAWRQSSRRSAPSCGARSAGRPAEARRTGLSRSSRCLRHPYRVKPRGLYTLSTAIPSRTTRPAPGCSRSAPRRGRRRAALTVRHAPRHRPLGPAADTPGCRPGPHRGAHRARAGGARAGRARPLEPRDRLGARGRGVNGQDARQANPDEAGAARPHPGGDLHLRDGCRVDTRRIGSAWSSVAVSVGQWSSCPADTSAA